jgi:ABC-type xylose transport system permease subunit
MMRFLVSLIIGVIVGGIIGALLGWGVFATIPTNVPTETLAGQYKEEYLLMIAGGYWEDADILGAFERLKILNVENIPQFVQDVTEQYITSSRAVAEIYLLVALSEGFGRLTPIMQPYRQVNIPQSP